MKYTFESSVSTAAIALLLGATPTFAQETGGAADRGDEIIVTARKRSESLQDVPLSVQALGAEEQAKGALKSLEDYALRLPSLTYSQFLPGQTIIVFRGATTTAETFNGTSSSALYLDEIPMQFDGANPEIRLVDMERLEAVSGPQPTTYGASSQSGTLKYVTVAPNLSEFGGFLEVGGSVLEDGDESYDISGAVNIPLIEDKLALRIAGWRAEEGGYIDVVEGSSALTHAFLAPGDDPSVDAVFGPGASGITRNNIRNDGLAEDDIGRYITQGVRATMKWAVNENWSVTAMVQWQDSDGNGVPAFNPAVGDLQAIRFNDEFVRDEWYATLLKVEGDLGFADFTSSTTYFDRDFVYQIDASAYWSPTLANGLIANAEFELGETAYLNPAYQAGITSFTPGYNSYYVATEFTDTNVLSLNEQETQRFSQEIRLTSKEGSPVQWMAGGYYEKFDDRFEFVSQVSGYPDSLAAYVNVINYGYYYGYTPNEPAALFASLSDNTIEQWAVFAELGFDITDRLNVLGGARYFDIDQTNRYLTIINDGNFVFTCDRVDPADELSACLTDSNGELVPLSVQGPDDGFVTLVTLSYDVNDDTLAYFTRSSGFRTGGANILRPTSTAPNLYTSDKLVNYEIGLKSQWLDGRLTTNLSAYHMIWRDLQINVTDPTLDFGFSSIILNAGKAIIEGVEGNWSFDVTDTLTFDGSAAYIDARSAEAVTLATPLVPDQDFVTVLEDGEQLPLSPNWKFNLGLEKGFDVPSLDGEAYIRFDYTYVGEQRNGTSGSILLTAGTLEAPGIQPSYDLGRIGMGFDRDDWSINFSVNNLWNERPVLFNPPRFADNRVYTARPREYSLYIRKAF